MFSSTEKQLINEILTDYLKFKQRVIKDDDSILGLVEILQKPILKKKLLSQKQLADELGIDKRTLIKKIYRNVDLYNTLIEYGWRTNQRGFYPKELEMIRKQLF